MTDTYQFERDRKDRIALLEMLLVIAVDCKTPSEFATHLDRWQLSQAEHWHVALFKGVQALTDELKELQVDRDVVIRILNRPNLR